MAVEEGGNPHLTETGQAVVRRFESEWESHLASTSSTIENRIPAARQSQIIHDCLRSCFYLVSNARGVHYHPVHMDRAIGLIIDTLLILQDRHPPQRPHNCIGRDERGGICRRQITRNRLPWAMPLESLDVVVTLRQPAGSYVVSGISIYPVIRRFDHPRLCQYHKQIVESLLHNVLLTIAY